MLRKFLCFILLFSLGVSGNIFAQKCGGIERWSIKVLSDKNSNKINMVPQKTTVVDLITLPTTVPAKTAPRQGPEFNTYQVDCNIEGYFTESDSDVHIILSDPSDNGKTLIAEIPDPACPSVTKSGRSSIYQKARDAFGSFAMDGAIMRGNQVHHVQSGLYRVTGVGFVDFAHNQRGKAPNNFEIHPILKIEKLK